LRFLEQGLRYCPENTAIRSAISEIHTERAQRSLAHGLVDQARKLLSQALEVWPRNRSAGALLIEAEALKGKNKPQRTRSAKKRKN